MITLSTENKEIISKYFNYYAQKQNSITPVNIEKALAEWATSKENLYNLMGEQLILTKPFTFENTNEQLQQVNHIMDKYWESIFRPISNTFFHGGMFERVKDCFENQIKQTFTLTLRSDGVTGITFEKGMRYWRALRKALKATYQYGEVHCFPHSEKEINKVFNEFREEVSRVTQIKKKEGKLCLSIHPLDFATLSDNDNNWASCMSWRNSGCYSTGTVEMMNSSYVLCAYFTDKDFDTEPGIIWNSKMWRCLFIVHNDIVIEVEPYPYHNEVLTKEVLNWIADLGKDRWSPTIRQLGAGGTFVWKDKEERIEFLTNWMYNDIYEKTRDRFLLINEETFNFESINYSGKATCICCGGIIDEDDEYGDENHHLICEDCKEKIYCADCGSRIYDGDEWVRTNDGDIVCYDCWVDKYRHCDNCEKETGTKNAMLTRIYSNNAYNSPYGDYYYEGERLICEECVKKFFPKATFDPSKTLKIAPCEYEALGANEELMLVLFGEYSMRQVNKNAEVKRPWWA